MSLSQKFKFKAKIYKTGINWCVDLPAKITQRMTSEKGRIKIKGQINGFDFTKTLMPVKNGPHRLFVNLQMMKGGKTALGQSAQFEIEQTVDSSIKKYAMPQMLIEKLATHQVAEHFENLSASRKNDILKYLSYLKTVDTLEKNIDKLISQLQNKEKKVRIP
jgi:hypothetical protein